MIKYNFIKTLTVGVALATAFYPQAWACEDGYVENKSGACIPTTGSCGTNCEYTYDISSDTLTCRGTGPNGSGKVDNAYLVPGLRPIKNVIIAEGITEIKNNTPVYDIGAPDGKLVLPSTLTNFAKWSSHKLRFGTIEINSENMTFDSMALRFEGSEDRELTIIMPDSNNITFYADSLYSDWNAVNGFNAYPVSLNVVCKGDVSVCERRIASAKNQMEQAGVSVSVSNQLKDSNGNVIEEWAADGTSTKYAYDESGKLLASYDSDGNIINGRQIRDDGSVVIVKDRKIVGLKKTTPFTPAEAAALVKKGNHNTVTLTFK